MKHRTAPRKQNQAPRQPSEEIEGSFAIRGRGAFLIVVAIVLGLVQGFSCRIGRGSEPEPVDVPRRAVRPSLENP